LGGKMIKNSIKKKKEKKNRGWARDRIFGRRVEAPIKTEFKVLTWG
jgi:hypothetical protein